MSDSLLVIISSVITAVIGYLIKANDSKNRLAAQKLVYDAKIMELEADKAKREQELKIKQEMSELDDIDKAVRIWRELSESLQTRVDNLQEQVTTLITEKNILLLKLSQLERIIANQNT